MQPELLGGQVRGASHKRKHTRCEDRFLIKQLSENASVVVVADGHGTNTCPYSGDGAQFAVNVFYECMRELYARWKNNIDSFVSYLHREGELAIAKKVVAVWRERICLKHQKEKRTGYDIAMTEKTIQEICSLYGTTLVGMLIMPDFAFAFQIGDGDIVYIDQNTSRPFLETEKILGVATHSICSKEAWRNAKSGVVRNYNVENKNMMFMLSTDGLSNSYAGETEFLSTCKSYFDVLNEYGVIAVNNNLHAWLRETSEQGSGDDISVAIAYFEGGKQEIMSPVR